MSTLPLVGAGVRARRRAARSAAGARHPHRANAGRGWQAGGGRVARALTALIRLAQRDWWSRLPVSIRLRALGVYLFGVIVAYLAATYLGGFFSVLYRLLVFLPIASLVAVAYGASRLRYTQRFSTEHPVKGQVIEYRCVIENSSIFAIPSLRATFHAILPVRGAQARAPRIDEPAGMSLELNTFLPGREQIDRTQDVQLRYRGTYTLGLDRVEVGDTLQLFRLRPRINRRTFRVYPRVLQVQGLAPGSDRRAGTSQVGEAGMIPDYSLFNHLREYRSSESIRHLAWRKFASTGVPVVREYDATSEPSVLMYLDLRPVPSSAPDVLATEDVSVEAVVALVNHFLTESIPLTLRASDNSYEFAGDHRADFARFYESTFDLVFRAGMSAAELFRLHSETGMVADANSVFFVTHILDPEILGLLEQQHSGLRVSLIYNETATPDDEATKAERRRYFNRLREAGTRLIRLRSPHSIAEDLERDDESFD